jgi:hypothetical protein
MADRVNGESDDLCINKCKQQTATVVRLARPERALSFVPSCVPRHAHGMRTECARNVHRSMMHDEPRLV